MRRSYIDITNCQLCKVNGYHDPADDAHAKPNATATTVTEPHHTPIPATAASKDCFYCAARLKSYISLATNATRHATRWGYRQVQRAWKMRASAPVSAICALLSPLPAPSDTEAVSNHITSIRRTLCTAGYGYEYEAVQNIIIGAQTDIDVGHARLSSLRSDVEIAYAELSSHRQHLMTRRFGLRMFNGSMPVKLDVMRQLEQQGWGDMTRFDLDAWRRVRRLVKRGLQELEEMKHDIELHERVKRKAARLAVAATKKRVEPIRAGRMIGGMLSKTPSRPALVGMADARKGSGRYPMGKQAKPPAIDPRHRSTASPDRHGGAKPHRTHDIARARGIRPIDPRHLNHVSPHAPVFHRRVEQVRKRQ